MAWTKEWTKVEGYCTNETIYEKKYFNMGGVARGNPGEHEPEGA